MKVVGTSAGGDPTGTVTFTLFGPFSTQPTDSSSCSNGAPVAGTSTVTIPSGKFVSHVGYVTAGIDVPAVSADPTAVGSRWYAWGATFAPATTDTAYTAASLGCSAEQVNVQYAAGSGGELPSSLFTSLSSE